MSYFYLIPLLIGLLPEFLFGGDAIFRQGHKVSCHRAFDTSFNKGPMELRSLYESLKFDPIVELKPIDGKEHAFTGYLASSGAKVIVKKAVPAKSENAEVLGHYSLPQNAELSYLVSRAYGSDLIPPSVSRKVKDFDSHLLKEETGSSEVLVQLWEEGYTTVGYSLKGSFLWLLKDSLNEDVIDGINSRNIRELQARNMLYSEEVKDLVIIAYLIHLRDFHMLNLLKNKVGKLRLVDVDPSWNSVDSREFVFPLHLLHFTESDLQRLEGLKKWAEKNLSGGYKKDLIGRIDFLSKEILRFLTYSVSGKNIFKVGF